MASSWVGRVLEERIKDTVDSRSASLANGAAADYAQYQFNVGVIQGLNDALKILQEIESEQDERSSAA